MKAIRRTLKTYLEKKLEELVEMIYKDDGEKNLESGRSNSNSLTGEPTCAESEMQTGT